MGLQVVKRLASGHKQLGFKPICGKTQSLCPGHHWHTYQPRSVSSWEVCPNADSASSSGQAAPVRILCTKKLLYPPCLPSSSCGKRRSKREATVPPTFHARDLLCCLPKGVGAVLKTAGEDWGEFEGKGTGLSGPRNKAHTGSP